MDILTRFIHVATVTQKLTIKNGFLKPGKNSVASVTGVQLAARINVTAWESNKINFLDHSESSELVLETFL